MVRCRRSMSKRNNDENKRKSLVIIISKGTLDMAYPPLILAATAASMDMNVDLYFTFWGLSLLNKKKVGADKISPVGNPVLGMPNIFHKLMNSWPVLLHLVLHHHSCEISHAGKYPNNVRHS